MSINGPTNSPSPAAGGVRGGTITRGEGVGENGGGRTITRGSNADADEFAELMAKMKEAKANNQEVDKEDMQKLLSYSISQSLQTTARQMQQAAKDIERENIDKGF